MFDEIGGKIKAIAKGVFVVEVIATLILAICIAIESYDLGTLWFLLIMVGGIVLAYLSVIILYAFGELVENSTKIAWKVAKLLEYTEKSKKE